MVGIMQYIITENQRIKTYKLMLDMSLSSLRDKCNEMDELGAEAEEIVNFEACDQLSTTLDIKIYEVKHSNGFIVLFLDFYTESVSLHQNIDDLLYELKNEMDEHYGKNVFKLVHNETIHNKLFPDW